MARSNRSVRSPSRSRAALPISVYRAVTPRVSGRAKLFANGRSQAVRLPKDFRMPGTEVRIRKDGNRVILEPIADEPVDAKGWPIGFWGEVRRLAKNVHFPDPEPLGGKLLDPDDLDR
ncbi:MAG: AbrB/MazE/SpoVT family DNA-binding domain-containing protein [Planctomycetes bacterium]|nr:AbrB/MazE/SpoVT family DNA-binding domain-containing protein [Planctomycetota bacterium]